MDMEDWKDDTESGGGNGKATLSKWKQLMSKKPDKGGKFNSTTKFKKKKPTT